MTIHNMQEKAMRRLLGNLRDEAMTLAAMLELGAADLGLNDHALYQFVAETMNKAEYFMGNPKGELNAPMVLPRLPENWEIRRREDILDGDGQH